MSNALSGMLLLYGAVTKSGPVPDYGTHSQRKCIRKSGTGPELKTFVGRMYSVKGGFVVARGFGYTGRR